MTAIRLRVKHLLWPIFVLAAKLCRNLVACVLAAKLGSRVKASYHDLVAGSILAARQLHTLLFDKVLE